MLNNFKPAKLFNDKRDYFISFFLPIIILLVIFASIGLAPFGESNLLVSDLGAQYSAFLSYFKGLFTDANHSFLYSFSNGLGDNMVPLFAYYLMSPFNFITLFFSVENLPLAIQLIILLKIGTIGLSMTYYLKKRFPTHPINAWVFSTSYALCSYVLVYLYNIMWLDTLIWLPLVVLGLQQMLDSNKIGLYQVALFFCLLTNYYLGYMVCLFLVIYFFYWTIYKKSYKSFKEYYQDNIKKFGKFALISVLIAGSISFLLIPTVFGMMTTGKSSFDFSVLLPYPKFGLDVLTQLGPGTLNFNGRLVHEPALFSSTFITFGVAFYFLSTKIAPRKKRINAALLIILFLTLFINTFSAVFHMFQPAAGFPFRNSFLLIFVFICLAYEGFAFLTEPIVQKTKQITVVYSLLIVIGFAFHQLLAHFIDYTVLGWKSIALSIGCVILTGLIILQVKPYKTMTKKWVFPAIVFLLCGELFINGYYALHNAPLQNQLSFKAYSDKFSSAIDQLNEEDTSLFRVEDRINNTEENFNVNSYNFAMLYDFNSASSYSSTLNDSVKTTLGQLGLFTKNERRIYYVGNTPLIDYLLDMKYSITNNGENDQFTITQNYETNGMGFPIPTDSESLTFKKKTPFKNQNLLFKALSGLEDDIFTPNTFTTVNEIKEENKFISTFSIQQSNSGILYTYLPIAYSNIKSITVNGESLDSDIFITNKALLKLGEFDKDERVEVKIESTKEVKPSDYTFQTFNSNLFTQYVNYSAGSGIVLSRVTRNTISGKVVGQNDSTYFLSIPYDENWEITLDGKKIDSRKAFDCFTAINIPEGTHELTMKYSPKGYKVGIVLSILCFIILVSYNTLIYIRHRKKQNF